MENIETIKAEYAVDNGYSSWDELIIANSDYVNDLNEMIDDIVDNYAKQAVNAKLEEQINYIENEAEIAIPVNELMNEGGHLSKKEYGLVLLKYLCKELRERNNP